MHNKHCVANIFFLSGYFRSLRYFGWLCCAFFASSVAYAHTTSITPVIELAKLKARLAHHETDLLLVDVRNNTSYRHNHLPGAINIPVDLTFNQKGDHTRIASLQQIRDVLSQVGVRQQNYLVLYDNGMLKNASHVFWVLETYGQKKISVLDSGIAGWIADHDPLSQQTTILSPSNYIPSISPHRLSTELAIRLALSNPNVIIIDARSHAEYLGLSSRAKRKGHIPHSINIPWSDNLADVASVPRLKSRQALQSIYSMLHPNEKVIAYCNRGKESSVTYLVLRDLGYHVSIYDGAWLEWGNNDHLPIASSSITGTVTRYDQ